MMMMKIEINMRAIKKSKNNLTEKIYSHVSNVKYSPECGKTEKTKKRRHTFTTSSSISIIKYKAYYVKTPWAYNLWRPLSTNYVQ
jgi:hypothetical protein